MAYQETTRDRMRYTYTGKVLRKFGLTDKHLMRRFGSTPGIDKMTLDTYPRAEFVKAYMKDGRKFTIAVSALQEFGKVLDFGHGEQYFAPREMWEIDPR